MLEEQKHLGTITILVNDRHNNSLALNTILTDNGQLIMARLGVNVQPACISNCTALIILATKGNIDEIEKLNIKLNQLSGVKAELIIITK